MLMYLIGPPPEGLHPQSPSWHRSAGPSCLAGKQRIHLFSQERPNTTWPVYTCVSPPPRDVPSRGPILLPAGGSAAVVLDRLKALFHLDFAWQSLGVEVRRASPCAAQIPGELEEEVRLPRPQGCSHGMGTAGVTLSAPVHPNLCTVPCCHATGNAKSSRTLSAIRERRNLLLFRVGLSTTFEHGNARWVPACAAAPGLPSTIPSEKLNVPNPAATALPDIPTSPLKAFLVAPEMEENRLSSGRAMPRGASASLLSGNFLLPGFRDLGLFFGSGTLGCRIPAGCLV